MLCRFKKKTTTPSLLYSIFFVKRPRPKNNPLYIKESRTHRRFRKLHCSILLLLQDSPRLRLLHNNFRPQRRPNLRHATIHPLIIPIGTQGVQHQILATPRDAFHLGRWGGSNNIDFAGELLAVRVEREVVDVVAKWVFEFATNSDEAEDDVCSDWNVLVLVLFFFFLNFYSCKMMQDIPTDPGMASHLRSPTSWNGRTST
jgi:hypothetical protein